MNPDIQKAIEKHFGFTVVSCEAGRRQWVADTYILTDHENKRYFCKLITKPLFIPQIIKSLPVAEALYNNGMDKMCYPIRGPHGLHFFAGDTLVVLLNYLDLPAHNKYSANALGQLVARLHNMHEKISVDVPQEDFRLPHQELFDARLESLINEKQDDPALQKLQAVLLQNELAIRNYRTEWEQLATTCQDKDRVYVTTHGDILGNVLVREREDIYLIDWDDVKLAPLERDIWRADHFPAFLEGYETINPDFQVDIEMRRFYILGHYFTHMNLYFSEILDEHVDLKRKQELVGKLREDFVSGWFIPKLNGWL